MSTISQFDEIIEAYAEPQREQGNGVTVVVRNGETDTDSFTAWFADVKSETIDHRSGVKLNVTRRRYYLPKSSVAIDGSTFEPKPGMIIVQGSEQFEILPMSKEVAVQSDPGGYRWVVQAKQIAFS